MANRARERPTSHQQCWEHGTRGESQTYVKWKRIWQMLNSIEKCNCKVDGRKKVWYPWVSSNIHSPIQFASKSKPRQSDFRIIPGFWSMDHFSFFADSPLETAFIFLSTTQFFFTAAAAIATAALITSKPMFPPNYFSCPVPKNCQWFFREIPLRFKVAHRVHWMVSKEM